MFGREHGSKVGSGGTNSALLAEMNRKAHLKSLELDKIDISKDPYIVKNHLGSYDCRLCMTTHTTEGNYLAHTKGKRHLAGLSRRAARDAQLNQTNQTVASSSKPKAKVVRKQKIGKPVYRYLKQRDPETGQYSLLFMIEYPEITEGLQPRVRVFSAYEQKIERSQDRNWQYLLFAAEPYQTVAFKIPNWEVEREFDADSGKLKFWTNWDSQKKVFSLQISFKKIGSGTNQDSNGTHINGDDLRDDKMDTDETGMDNPEYEGDDFGNPEM